MISDPLGAAASSNSVTFSMVTSFWRSLRLSGSEYPRRPPAIPGAIAALPRCRVGSEGPLAQPVRKIGEGRASSAGCVGQRSATIIISLAPYLARFAQEAAWREDHKREANGAQIDRIVALAMAN
jgi:hypothetical protein